MRSWIVPLGFCLFFFIVPLQCFIIGGGIGAGIQGAVYRYQITTNGESIIPVTAESMYVVNGTITGRTAVSIIVWTLGTIVLTIVTILSLIQYAPADARRVTRLLAGSALAGLLYLAALVLQYGPLLSGPAGRSFPVGILLLFLFIGALYFFWDEIVGTNVSSGDNRA